MLTTIYRVIPVFFRKSPQSGLYIISGEEGRKLISIRTFHVYDQTVAHLGVRALHITLFCMCWFCENRQRKPHIFLMGVN